MAEMLIQDSHPFRLAEVSFYSSMARSTLEEAQAQMLFSLLRELRLDSDDLRRAILDRFHAWLELKYEDATRVAAAYDLAHGGLTPEQQITLDEAERDVIVNGLTFREFERLAEFVPWLRAWNVRPLPERPVSGPPAPYGLSLALLRN
jgi:hypothetical protein